MFSEFRYFISNGIWQSIFRANKSKNVYCLWIALLCSFIFVSCSHNVSVRPELIKSKHNVLVIPYKAAPIQIKSDTPAAVGILFGPLFIIADQASTRDERDVKASTLNKAQEEWNPATITANECISIINSTSKVPVESTTLANIRELPGADKLRLKEPRTFIAESSFSGYTDFAYFMGDWLKATNPTINYKKEYPGTKADWAMELSNSILFLREDSIELNVIIKIFDINSGELVANAFEYDKIKISPIKDMSDLQIFKKEFSEGVKLLCNRVLVKTELVGK